MTKVAFVEWVRRRLAPRLRHGDIVVLDNLQAHKAPEVRFFIEARGATVKRRRAPFLPSNPEPILVYPGTASVREA